MIFCPAHDLGKSAATVLQCADTLIVGRFLGRDALAAVGSAYTLMTFLTSILLGLSMGAGALFSIYQGRSDTERLRTAVVQAFLLIFIVCAGLYGVVYLGLEMILTFPPGTCRGISPDPSVSTGGFFRASGHFFI